MKEKIKHLTVNQVIRTNSDIIDEHGNTKGILNLSTIEFAVLRARGYKSQEDILFWKAALVLENIVKNHPFIDGNKRTGIASCKAFLEMNEYTLKAKDDKIIRFLLEIAKNKLSRYKIMQWIKKT